MLISAVQFDRALVAGLPADWADSPELMRSVVDELRSKVAGLPFPEGLGAEVGEGRAKGRLVVAPRDPPRLLDKAGGAQRLDQAPPRGVELEELAVALEHAGAHRRTFGPAVGHQHPQVVDRGPLDEVVEVEEDVARPAAAAQQVRKKLRGLASS